MINKKSLSAVDKALFSQQFCPPLYSNYCFSNIPETILSLFSPQLSGLPPETCTPGPYEQVVLLFIDGFGWRFFEKYKTQIGALAEFEKTGIVSKLTSMFPSTTAAHVTCIHSGLPPGESGIYEWFMREPHLERIVAPLLFSLAGDRTHTLLPIDPNQLYPSKRIYQKLGDLGVKSRVFQPKNISKSTYSRSMLEGADVTGYSRTAKAFSEMSKQVESKTYTYFYYPDIDSIGHRKGVHSPEFSAAIGAIFTEIQGFYSQLPSNTALIITSDHGMVEVDPERTYYLNEHIPNIEKYLLYGKDQKPLVPAGSCRDLFLHVRAEYLLELKEILEEFLGGIAEVHLTGDLIREGLFGKVGELFLARVGNLVVLPFAGEAVWWHEKGRFEQNFYAAHGGLTREEMEIPFIFLAK